MQQTAIQQTWLNSNAADSVRASTMTATSTETARRMSEPCHTMTDRKSPPPRPASVTLSPLKGTLSSSELHPNQAVVLDEVGEGEMVENKLVIPDDMVVYLNQVADNQNNDFTHMSWSDATPKPPNPTMQSQSAFPPAPVQSQAPNVNKPPPVANNINQIIPSPVNMTQMIHSPSTNLNQMLPSPASTLNHMMPSPGANQMVHSPSTNLNHQVMSPQSAYNQMMPSPSANFQNPMLSPAPSSVNQMIPSPAQNTMNQMVGSPMSVRCHPQLMSPSTTAHSMPSPAMPQNPMMNNQMMPPSQCYNNRPMPNNGCYVQHSNSNWDQNRMCQNQNQMSQHQNNMCNGNPDYNQQCRIPSVNNSYMSNNQCQNHPNYQVCNQNNGYCKPMNQNYPCNSYQHNQNYTYLQNMSEPLASPAMATPAPTEMMTQPQQAQMVRPCNHYNQSCYQQPYNGSSQCLPQHNCNCKNAGYPQQNKCHNRCGTTEIQCKDISQSQMSPGVANPQNNPAGAQNGGQTMLGMRQDTYQRTLEYVQNCQSWVTGNQDMVSSSTHPLANCGGEASTAPPSSNMVVNDMTSSLSSLLEENRYLQMIQ